MLELPVATTRCRQIPAVVIQHSQYFADLHGASISRTWFPRWIIRCCGLTNERDFPYSERVLARTASKCQD